MSAYDMSVSDAIYGTAERYVSRKRLQAMLDLEIAFPLLKRSTRPAATNALSSLSANTVTTKHIAKPGEEGAVTAGSASKFQMHPHGEPSTIIIHIRTLDWETSNT